MEILKCNLYDGQPYISEKDGKYHVMQGCIKADDVQKWYDTENEAIEQWNRRVKLLINTQMITKLDKEQKTYYEFGGHEIVMQSENTEHLADYKNRKMTLDDAIEHLGDVLQPNKKWKCNECRDEHIQLRDWLLELKHRREQSAADCEDGWILCSERMPEDGVDVLVWFEYFRYGEYNRLFQTTGISYTYNGDWSGFVNGESGWNKLRIIAWQPLPKPYCGN